MFWPPQNIRRIDGLDGTVRVVDYSFDHLGTGLPRTLDNPVYVASASTFGHLGAGNTAYLDGPVYVAAASTVAVCEGRTKRRPSWWDEYLARMFWPGIAPERPAPALRENKRPRYLSEWWARTRQGRGKA